MINVYICVLVEMLPKTNLKRKLIKKMKNLYLIFTILILTSCSTQKVPENTEKIKVLNFGTVHLSNSTDNVTSSFDLQSEKTRNEIKKVVDALVKFKPTIICVESLPEDDSEMNKGYQSYLKDQNYKTNYGKEIDLIVYEVGRLSNVKKIYGINHDLHYNFETLGKLFNSNEEWKSVYNKTINNYMKLSKLSFLEQIKIFNTNPAKENLLYDHNYFAMMSLNGNYEGADQATLAYQRNLRMFTNLNKIPMTKSDRILIILGGTHTAFFDHFLKNNPKFENIELKKYLKL